MAVLALSASEAVAVVAACAALAVAQMAFGQTSDVVGSASSAAEHASAETDSASFEDGFATAVADEV